VPPGPGPTLYTHIGDVFAWLCILLSLSLGLALLRQRPHGWAMMQPVAVG
jgi:apolipoprotein N-acyltransferase